MAAAAPSRRFAALDLGSLTVRLAVAEAVPKGNFRVLVHQREITGLGQGLAATGELAPEAMARTLAALQTFRQVMTAHRVAACRAVGTQALRQARNRRIFLAQVREAVGIDVEVLPPEAEARLSLTGVLTVLSPAGLATPEFLVFDVGGGSTEFALVRPAQEPVFASLPLGVLTLSQARPLGDPPLPARVAALKADLARHLRVFLDAAISPHLRGAPALVGTAGAVTTLAAMQLQMREYDADRVNNLRLTRTQVADMAQRLAELPEAARARLIGIEPPKAGVMVAGAFIVLAILEACRQDALVVIDAGLLEGVLHDLARQF